MSTNRRMMRKRTQTFHLKNRTVKKDREGNTYEEYGLPVPFTGKQWPAGGKVQAEIYGKKLPYIRNLKVKGTYAVEQRNGVTYYVFSDKLAFAELDGICLDVPAESGPDYKIISITPYEPLRMEVERR